MPPRRRGANLGRRTNNATNVRNSRAKRTEERIAQDNENARLNMSQLRTSQSQEARAKRNQQRKMERTQVRRFVKKKNISDEDKLIQMACAKLNRSKETIKRNTMPKSWESQYDQMEVSKQIIARNIISEVLFHGNCGSLQTGHVAQIHNIFNGYYAPAPNFAPQHHMMVPIQHDLKDLSNTSTPTSPRFSTSCKEEYSHLAQLQSPFLAYEQSHETLISPPALSEQYVDTRRVKI